MAFQVLVVDDNKLFNRNVCKKLVDAGYKTSGTYMGKDVIGAIEKDFPDIVLLDMKLPDMNGIAVLKMIKEDHNNCEIIMLTHLADTKLAVEAMKGGAFNYILKSNDLEELFLTMNNAAEKIKLRRNVSNYKKEEINKYGLDNIIAASENMKKVYEFARKAAQEATTCFILGENGTGKGLIARYIHYSSSRRDKPFVETSCNTCSSSLIDSHLFGHEKGAFTGATEKKIGLFERADGGTVFLDEIGEIQAITQIKLLKVIEEKTFERVGGDTPIKVDVRIITATNRDIEKAVREEKFRKDLYFRLMVVPIRTIPLRNRPEDVIPLAEYFIASFSSEFKKEIKPISEKAKKRLLEYKWWGNVRELRNATERAVLLGKGDVITTEDLMIESGDYVQGNSQISSNKDHGDFSVNLGIMELNEAEKKYCQNIFDFCNKNLAKAARVLGISRDRLRRKLTQEF